LVLRQRLHYLQYLRMAILLLGDRLWPWRIGRSARGTGFVEALHPAPLPPDIECPISTDAK
jgi:hypothetical protein